MKKKNLPKVYLIKEYIQKKKTASQIAKENNCAVATVNRWLTIYEIPKHGYMVENLIDKKFGKWTVIKRGKNESSGAVKWVVQCECGNRYEVNGYTLRNSKSNKCKKCRISPGKDHPQWKGCGDLSATIWNRIKNNAKRSKAKKKIIDVSIKDGWNLFQKQNGRCALTNLPIQFGSYYINIETTASLDRIDSSKGYTKDNIHWVHKDINKMKQDLTLESFVKYCKLVAIKD